MGYTLPVPNYKNGKMGYTSGDNPRFERLSNTKDLKDYQAISYSLFIEYLTDANESGNEVIIKDLLNCLERSTKFYHRWFNWTPKKIVLDNALYYQFNKILKAPPPPAPKPMEFKKITVSELTSDFGDYEEINYENGQTLILAKDGTYELQK